MQTSKTFFERNEIAAVLINEVSGSKEEQGVRSEHLAAALLTV